MRYSYNRKGYMYEETSIYQRQNLYYVSNIYNGLDSYMKKYYKDTEEI